MMDLLTRRNYRPPLNYTPRPLAERVCTCGRPGGVHRMDCDQFTMSRMFDDPEVVAAEAAYRVRAIQDGCCGHPDGPTWDEYRDPDGTVHGRWKCRYAGPRGCCMNQVEEFIARFRVWLINEGKSDGK